MALIDLKSNLSNFRSDFSHESKLKSPVNVPSAALKNLQKESPNNVPGQRYINGIKVDNIIKIKSSPVNPIKTLLSPKTSLIAPNTPMILEKVSSISPLKLELKDKDSSINPNKTELKDKDSSINPNKTELKDKKSSINPNKTELKAKSSSINPNKTELKDKKSQSNIPGVVDFFNDVKSGAKGFILKANDRNQSSFLGISGTTYNHPKLAFHILQVGNASLDNQLPDGSIFRYLKSGASSTMKFSDKGYNDKNKYGSIIQSVKGQPNKSLLYTRSSESSALDAEYKKFNLRDDAYNPTYMKHPLVLRDIGKRWGSPFDDGLIRGGIVTAVERAAMDTVRIAKWMASPRGLLWIVKQVGLGMTNPRVEGSMPSLLGRPSRIHSGITSLLSVAGTAFGLHFTTHGIPIVNALSNYEVVVNARNGGLSGENYYIPMKTPDTYALGVAKGNRLLKLRKDLLPRVKPKPGEKKEFGKFMSVVKSVVAKLKSISGHTGAKIDVLSGLGGPGSVYGIGSTTIHRHAISDEKAIAQAAKQNWHTKYTYNNQYATLGVVTDYRSSVGGPESSDTPSLNAHGIDELKDSLWTTMTTFGKKDNGAPGTNNTTRNKHVNLESGDGRAATFPKAGHAGIKSYATVAYNLLKRDTATSFQDFRNDVKAQKDGSEKSYVGKPKDKTYYQTKNLETYYGFGKAGMPNADRSDPNKFLITNVKDLGQLYNHKNFRGDSVNALDIDNKTTDKIYPKGAKDLIKFYFQDGDQGHNVMPFRCTMTGFTDNFSPSWNRIDIMGRPDGAYLYSSFERSVSFNFIVAAMSRSEMIPMWRKINYLATYTMPDLSGNKKPSGPMMRITIGDLFQETPGFITSLSYTIPDDATWDIAEDSESNPTSKQLPMMVDIAMSFQIIGDYRPEQMGRAYSLSPGGASKVPGDWLSGKSHRQGSEAKADAE